MATAWIDKRERGDGGVSARVVWRLGGTRDGAYQAETFSVGSDAQNLARADGFKKMVDAAGQSWPDGWVKGEGFVRPAGTHPLQAPPRFDEIGEEYVRQIVDLSPGQRKRYLGQLPLHNGDFYTHVWRKLKKALVAEGIAPFRFHEPEAYPRRLACRRRCAAAAHPGTVGP